MKIRLSACVIGIVMLFLSGCATTASKENSLPDMVTLPDPRLDGNMPMFCLKKDQTTCYRMSTEEAVGYTLKISKDIVQWLTQNGYLKDQPTIKPPRLKG